MTDREIDTETKNKGWVRIWRDLADKDYWLDEKFTKGQAWVDLIMLANHKPKTIYVRGIAVVVDRGQVGWSEEALAKRWKWSRMKVRRFKLWLKRYNKIDNKNDNVLGVITILNYDMYQESEQQTRQQTIQQKARKRYTNKNDNNINNYILSKDNIHEGHEVFGNEKVNYILNTYKKFFNHTPTDKKPRNVAYVFAKSIEKFIKEIEPYKKFEFFELVDKIFKWYDEKYQIKGDTLDVIRRKAKMLFEATIEKYKGGEKK